METPWLNIVCFLAAGYVIGSIPGAVVVSRIMRLEDPLKAGSGNPGATNVLRLGGKLAGALTLACDLLKGTAVVLAARLIAIDPTVVALAALAVFLGHVYSVFLGFKGGKGVATAIGIFLGMKFVLALAVGGIWIAVAAVSRYASLSSMTAITLSPILCWFFLEDVWFVAAASVIALFVIATHRSNIKRLVAGNESKINLKKQG